MTGVIFPSLVHRQRVMVVIPRYSAAFLGDKRLVAWIVILSAPTLSTITHPRISCQVVFGLFLALLVKI